MNPIHKKRLVLLSLFLLGLMIAVSLILFSLKQNINVFLTPAEIAQASFSHDDYFRLGGMVKKGSVTHEKDGLRINFVVTDFKKELNVQYTGILPDLFREGKGVIASGYLNADGIFIASEVLAKHDENYMPKQMHADNQDHRGFLR